VLYSMTGYGEASYQSDALSVGVELRAVNNRFLKVTLRAAEPYNLLEPEFEKVIRRTIRRGTIQVHFRCQKQYAPQDFQVNTVALRAYLSHLMPVCQQTNLPESAAAALLSGVLALPGVVPEPAGSSFHLEDEWPVIAAVLDQALGKLQNMRREEGKAMAGELLQLRDHMRSELDQVRARLPSVAIAYRDRMLERVRALLGELDVRIDRNDLIKEVSVFADRADVTEEVVRLSSHLDQFQEILQEPESPGRKLDFLTQEMLRETNTLGSKAGDIEISRHVFEVKGTLEKIRELVQNVE
jgi:uncharacterized protein (TIGR00255 family)